MTGAVNFDWTEERIETLRKMWFEGCSASKIASDIGGDKLSRRAVIGKVHRLGLTARLQGRAPAGRRRTLEQGVEAIRAALPIQQDRPRLASQPPKAMPSPGDLAARRLPKVIADVFTAPADAFLVTIHELRRFGLDCRWPFTCDDGETRYCGKVATDGAWCCEHATLAYAGAARPTMREFAPTKGGRGLAMQREARR